MPPDPRITIRLSAVLAARLAAKVGPRGNLAASIRRAIEAYLADDPVPRQPQEPPMAAMAATPADTAATLAAINARLALIEQRLTVLEATSVGGSQRQPAAAMPADADADRAYARMLTLREQGLTLAQIAAQLTTEGHRTRHGRPWHKSTVSYVLRTHGRTAR
jgi:hypothetical protein